LSTSEARRSEEKRGEIPLLNDKPFIVVVRAAETIEDYADFFLIFFTC